MATINLTNVSKEFRLSRDKHVLALSAMDLTVREGEFIALLGPSGCGKAPSSTSSPASTKPPPAPCSSTVSHPKNCKPNNN